MIAENESITVAKRELSRITIISSNKPSVSPKGRTPGLVSNRKRRIRHDLLSASSAGIGDRQTATPEHLQDCHIGAVFQIVIAMEDLT